MFGENWILITLILGIGPPLWEDLGVCCVALNPLDLMFYQQNGGRLHIKACVFDKYLLKDLCIVVIYGAAQDENNDEFLSCFEDICIGISLPTVIGGDLNIIRFAGKRNKGCGVNSFSDKFNSIINSFSLREIQMSGVAPRPRNYTERLCNPQAILHNRRPWNYRFHATHRSCHKH